MGSFLQLHQSSFDHLIMDSFWLLFVVLLLKGDKAFAEDTETIDDSSCEDRCDATYVPNKPCYCNEACSQYENCCFDYYDICRPDFIWSDDWQVYNGHKYKYFANSSITADQASDACLDVGALLASINSQQENTFIKLNVLKKRTLSAFIGGTDKEKEGTWIWEDGTSISLPTDDTAWHEWFEGQPDNSGDDENCLIMTNYQFWNLIKFMIDNYVWRDYTCTANMGKLIQGYVCEGTTACDSDPCLNNGTCVYAGVQQEYKCLCTDDYLGNHCQYEVVKGEPWTRCGETNLQGHSGMVKSPLYPDLYPNNAECLWSIEVGEEYTVHLEFEEFQLEGGKDCTFDQVTIYDGDSLNHTSLSGAICGERGELKQPLFRSSGNKVLVEFKSDHSIRYGGFHLTYAEEKCGEGLGQSGCGTRQTFTSYCADIHLQHGPLRNEEMCQWLIDVPLGNVVNLTFAEFDILYSSSGNCSSGHLSVYDGPSTESPLLGQYCGNRFPWSIISTTSQVYMELTGKVFTKMSSVKIKYETIDTSVFQYFHDVHIIEDFNGEISTSDWSVNMQISERTYKKWLIKVNPGDKLKLTYKAEMYENTTFQIFDGSTEMFPILVDIDDTYKKTEMINVAGISMFQALIVLAYDIQEPDIKIAYQSEDWNPDLSGCYRPFYYDAPGEKAVENNPVSPRQPVVIMASDKTKGGENVYEAGIYCKWKMMSSKEWPLSLDVLDFNVFPVTSNCQYDGVVVYFKNEDGTINKAGPFCGEGLSEQVIPSNSTDIEVVFYSANRGNARQGGIFRAVVTAIDTEMPYQVHEMITDSNVLVSTHGVLLSPGFPFLVTPGVYFWVIDSGAENQYFNIYLYYVRGPALSEGCKQFFKVLEISKAKGTLRHDETALLTLCSETDVFIPTKRIKLPPKQKFAIELNTAESSLPQPWQFKLAYSTNVLQIPAHTDSETEVCNDADYHYFRGKCYKYIPWVYRHYYPEYNFQETWQGSQDYCERENATLVNIHDLEIADFLKFMLGTAWYWADAQYQLNNRMIFIGLTNKNGFYEWMDTVQLSYADWYNPGESWEQPLFHVDTIGTDFINIDNIQPAATGNLQCVAMVPLSPYGSLNWVKIPCDYPMFRSGLICEKSAKDKTTNNATEVLFKLNVDTPKKIVENVYERSISVCPSGYIMFKQRCIQLYTNYTLINMYYDMKDTNEEPEETFHMQKGTAETICNSLGGHMTFIAQLEFQDFIKYLQIWNHDIHDGNIWMAETSKCNFIHVYRQEDLSEVIMYSVEESICNKISNVRSVLCETNATVITEACGQNEFECSNGMCISVDGRCDNHNDCIDNSDESGCGCGEDMYQCSNGQCIPLSLYCDFVDHCGDNSDEQNCVTEICDRSEFRCGNGQCISKSEVCDFKVHCADNSDEMTTLCESQCKGIQCFSGSCINPQLEMDLIPDCPGFALEDEINTNTNLATFFDVFKNNNISDIDVTPSIPKSIGCDMDGFYSQCRDDHPHCYRRDKICIFDTTIVNEVSGTVIQDTCRDGNHLRTNCDSVEHNGLFQCKAGYISYYIPLRKLCDGQKDCPYGEDELECDQFTCPGLLKCKGSSYCISHTEICDGEIHCPLHKDDEKYCRMQDILCSMGCDCSGLVINCENRNIMEMPSDNVAKPTTRALNLRGNHVKITSSSFRKYHFLGRLILSHNKIMELPTGVFKDLRNLFELDLSFNNLMTFQKGVFDGLQSLQKLDLSHNLLSELTRESLSGLIIVKHLILTNNHLNIVPDDTFNDLTHLDIINTDSYKFCCIAKHVRECTPKGDEFSSCEDLMASYTLQISIWVLGMMALLGNIFVVVWRIKKERSKVSSFFIINLGMSDFLMGVYLVIIATVDVVYRGKYIIYADDWKTSRLCQFAGVLSTLSSEVSVFMLTAITTERFLAIVFPLKVGQLRMRYARLIAVVGWSVCFFLSILPTSGLPYFGDAFFGRTGVCLPFHLSDDKLPGWEYSVFVFLVVNFLSFLAILVGYVIIFAKVKSANKQMSAKSTGSTDEYQLAKKLVIIVATDFICWVPIILIGFAALGGVPIPPQVSAWVAVFILPLNSSINPILYTISALEFSRKRKRRQTYTNRKSSQLTASTKAVSSVG